MTLIEKVMEKSGGTFEGYRSLINEDKDYLWNDVVYSYDDEIRFTLHEKMPIDPIWECDEPVDVNWVVFDVRYPDYESIAKLIGFTSEKEFLEDYLENHALPLIGDELDIEDI